MPWCPPCARAECGGVPSLRAAALLAGWLLCAGTVAVAESLGIAGMTARQAYFGGFDRNGDGRVDEEEYLAYLRQGFDYLDVNRDGRLDDRELPAGARRSVSRERRGHELAVRQAFRRLDRDGNGWLDVEELTAPPR